MEVVGRMNESSNIETEDVYIAHNHKKFNSFCIADILQLESRETSPREKLIVRPWDDCRKSSYHGRGGRDFLPSSADRPSADPVDCQRNPLTSLYLMMINSNHPRRTQNTQLEFTTEMKLKHSKEKKRDLWECNVRGLMKMDVRLCSMIPRHIYASSPKTMFNVLTQRNLLQNSCPFEAVRSYHSPVYIRNFLKKRRKTRTAFTNQQLIQLEKRFRFQKYLTPADRDEVASSLNLSNSQVITWFQNRRAKLKRDMEELKADMNAAKILGSNCSSLTKLEEFFQSNCHKKKC